MDPERSAAIRAFLRATNGLGSRAVERLWASASAAAGLAIGERTPRWSSGGRERVLAIAPHPDDESIGCAGTLIRHRHRGDFVSTLIVTDGSRSGALGLDRRSMGTRRKDEAIEAALRMGIDCRWLGLPEGDWSDEEGEATIRGTLDQAAPTIVYAPSIIDYHPEHRRVARALAAALAGVGAPPLVRVYPAQVPLTPVLANLVHDVSDLDAHIRSVLACYATQRDSVLVAGRLRRYAARLYRFASEAESFFSLSARDYVSLHARPDAAFRPLMTRAWTDPIAILVGLPERISWRLRTRAELS